MKMRKERFGTLTESDKKEKRKNRFGLKTETEKKDERKKRFGVTSNKTEKSKFSVCYFSLFSKFFFHILFFGCFFFLEVF